MRNAIGLAAALSIVMTTVPAIAQTTDAASARLRNACSTDYFEFCNGLEANSPEVARCFRKNMRKLSPACRSAIAESRNQGARGGRRSR